jgi:hypothetical protein
MGQMPGNLPPIGGGYGLGLSRTASVGLGMAAVGGAFMGMMPRTMDAVTRRVAAETIAGTSGVSLAQ